MKMGALDPTTIMFIAPLAYSFYLMGDLLSIWFNEPLLNKQVLYKSMIHIVCFVTLMIYISQHFEKEKTANEGKLLYEKYDSIN